MAATNTVGSAAPTLLPLYFQPHEKGKRFSFCDVAKVSIPPNVTAVPLSIFIANEDCCSGWIPNDIVLDDEAMTALLKEAGARCHYELECLSTNRKATMKQLDILSNGNTIIVATPKSTRAKKTVSAQGSDTKGKQKLERQIKNMQEAMKAAEKREDDLRDVALKLSNLVEQAAGDYGKKDELIKRQAEAIDKMRAILWTRQQRSK